MHLNCNVKMACVKPNSAELILIDFKSVKALLFKNSFNKVNFSKYCVFITVLTPKLRNPNNYRCVFCPAAW